MEMPDMLGEIRDLNLTYLMLAQQMIRDDKSAAVYR
ncbi:MAG: flagellar transcriptional regulator FlhD, partial [Betaproteobacteria bacterium]|nr:flagellar transcriptional regulator FlhD [Betaproteobacteria bacterium]